MTTNDLITLIIKNHMDADSLAQIASAVECLQEQLADVAAARERMRREEVASDRCDGCERGCDACNDGHTGDGEPSDDGADAEWLASAGWGTDEDYE
jgi:hypothetical protein